MIRKTSSLYKKTRGFVLVGSLAALGYMVFAVPPSSWVVVFLFVIMASLFLATLAALFMRLRDSLIVGATAFVFLLLASFFGFNLLNSVLLISFVLGLRFLIQ